MIKCSLNYSGAVVHTFTYTFITHESALGQVDMTWTRRKEEQRQSVDYEIYFRDETQTTKKKPNSF